MEDAELADIAQDANDLAAALLSEVKAGREVDDTGARLATLLAQVAVCGLSLQIENRELRRAVERLRKPWWRRCWDATFGRRV